MRDFLKTVFASFVGLLLFSTLSLGGLIAFLALIALGSRSGPIIEDDSVLVLDLSLDITDAGPSADPGAFINDTIAGRSTPEAVSLRTVLEAIHAAENDDRISGLLIQGNIDPAAQGSGFATLYEVRKALEAFQESGKSIYAYETDWSEWEYYLTSLADTVILNSTGGMELNGLSAENTFFAGALDKFGIDVQVLRAGNFKSAVEPFIRSDNSPENEQQLQAFLNDLWNEFLTATAASRDLQPNQLQQIANTKGFILANDALSAGLVDEVSYASEVIDQLRELTGQAANKNDKDAATFRYTDLLSYAQATESMSRQADKIAVIYAEGEIVSGEGGFGTIGGDSLSRLLREVRADEAVKAVVLRVNSPGGGASPSAMIAHEVMLTSEVKPVIISMGNVAASGGYMISAYGDRIFASPTTITGSIGVFGLVANVKELANENGVTWDVVKTAPFADSGTLARPLTPQEIAIQQQIIDRTYDDFLTIVAEGRSLDKAKVNSVAQGRVWSGIQAQKVGLVDELGGLEAAIQAAADQAKLGDSWSLQEYPESRTFPQQLLASLFGVTWRDRLARTHSTDPLTAELLQVQSQMQIFSQLNDPRQVYSVMPFLPTIH